jgi:hypothetical protein
MSLKPYVFVPPGAGHRRRGPVKAVEKPGKSVLHAGWLLTAVMGVLLMAVVTWISVEKAKQPALVGHGLHGKGLENVREVGFALMETSALMSGLVLYALLTLYLLAWLVVPLVAMAQGKGWGAILFFLGSPVMLYVAGFLGWGIGMILNGKINV